MRVMRLKEKHPTAKVELWCEDEQRLGLKPIVRKVWSPIGQRPLVEVHQRCEWSYLYAFARPARPWPRPARWARDGCAGAGCSPECCTAGAETSVMGSSALPTRRTDRLGIDSRPAQPENTRSSALSP